MEALLCECINDLCHSLFHLLNCLITTSSKVFLELREQPKVTGSKVWTIGRLRNCLDAHLGQIVCDKDKVVDWCPVLVAVFVLLCVGVYIYIYYCVCTHFKIVCKNFCL